MPPVIRHRNGKLYIDNAPLIEGALQKTFLVVAADDGHEEIFVKDGSTFKGNADDAQVRAILIGELGDENSEIRLFDESVVQVLGDAGDSVALIDAALAYSHPAGTPVYLIDYNQIEISVASVPDSGEAAPIDLDDDSGIIVIQPDTRVQVVDVSAEFEEGYIFARYALNEELPL